MYCRHFLTTLFVACLIAQAQAGNVRVEGKFISTTTSGPPLEVSSTDNVGNLNADKLDGFDVGDFAVADSGVGVHWKNLVGLPGQEINQDCALNTGCFSGDTAGFPVTITEAGSYRLATNLDVSGESNPENVTAIEIDATNVTLDFRGFAIIGPGVAGSGKGISQVFGTEGVTVMNGAIEGMGDTGLDIDEKSIVIRIRSSFNGGRGIQSGFGSVISESLAVSNGGDGIFTGTNSVVTGNVARNNGGNGITAQAGSQVNNNVAAGNDVHGLELTTTSTGYAGNVMNNNTDTDVSSGTQLGKNLCSGSLC